MSNTEALDQLLGERSPEVVAVVHALRTLIRGLIPTAFEHVDLPDRLIAYGYGTPKGVRVSNLLVGIIPYSAHANLMFADGAQLPDPAGILEGTGKLARHVKCGSAADVDQPAVAALIRAEAALHAAEPASR